MKLDMYHEDAILVNAIAYYGNHTQTLVAIEELSELQKELCKYLRNEATDEYDISTLEENIIEEIADVEIMLKQLKILHSCEANVEKVKKEKIRRLYERMHGGS